MPCQIIQEPKSSCESVWCWFLFNGSIQKKVIYMTIIICFSSFQWLRLTNTIKWHIDHRGFSGRQRSGEPRCLKEIHTNIKIIRCILWLHIHWELFVLAWCAHTSDGTMARYTLDLIPLLHYCRHPGICFEADHLLPTDQFKNCVPKQEAQSLKAAASIINSSRIAVCRLEVIFKVQDNP